MLLAGDLHLGNLAGEFDGKPGFLLGCAVVKLSSRLPSALPLVREIGAVTGR